jgi:hypothetical protein
MIDSLQVENFRCYERLELHGLKRVNIVVGPNSSGKTALLEAVYLAAGGHPEVVLKMRVWRGLGQSLQVSNDRRSYESLWKDLFHRFDQKKIVSTSIVGSRENTRSARVYYESQESFTLPLATESLVSSATIPITFEWTDYAGEKYISRPQVTGQALNLQGAGQPVRSAFFSVMSLMNPTESAAQFSDLSKENKEELVIKTLAQEFPYISDLSVESNAGNWLLYGTVASMPEKLPLALISAGINRLVGIWLGISALAGGVILADEIENGIYYKMLPKVWSSLLRFSKQYETQLFVTTHSQECLNAIMPTLQDNANEFSILKTEKTEEGASVTVFAGDQLLGALEHGFEVR